MRDLLDQWEAKLIEVVGELHACERRRKEIERDHGYEADASREHRRGVELRKQYSSLMELFPEVELDLVSTGAGQQWKYEEYAIEPVRDLLGTKYQILLNGEKIGVRRSLRKAKKQFHKLLRNRILDQVNNVMA